VNFLLLRSLDARSLTSSTHGYPNKVTTLVPAYSFQIMKREKKVHNRLRVRTRIRC
jgi:hypothetical protein